MARWRFWIIDGLSFRRPQKRQEICYFLPRIFHLSQDDIRCASYILRLIFCGSDSNPDLIHSNLNRLLGDPESFRRPTCPELRSDERILHFDVNVPCTGSEYQLGPWPRRKRLHWLQSCDPDHDQRFHQFFLFVPDNCPKQIRETFQAKI